MWCIPQPWRVHSGACGLPGGEASVSPILLSHSGSWSLLVDNMPMQNTALRGASAIDTVHIFLYGENHLLNVDKANTLQGSKAKASNDMSKEQSCPLIDRAVLEIVIVML
ncbi:hypothetical protein VNO77_19547 [Canavalia gladiata]|uniref:Uncharacterized protein n=1 Tax=Canavalia gladiata TaxID=3824 RepID=A0AAN9QPQ6_CANGL